MRALKICQHMRDDLKNKRIKGFVHSVFNRACNILTEDYKIYSILSSQKSMAPLSVIIKTDKGFKELGITQGMDVVIDSKGIKIIDLDMEIDLQQAKVWKGTPDFNYNKAKESVIIERLRIIEESIYNFGKLDGIAPIIFYLGKYNQDLKSFGEYEIDLNQYCSFIEHRFIRLFEAISRNDFTNFLEGVEQIIGFGPGLTPSTDDFIGGLLVSFVYIANYLNLDVEGVKERNRRVIQDLSNKTTKISFKMLESAAIGEVSEDVMKLLKSIFVEDQEEELLENIQNVLNFGETSGTDTLCGIYSGCKIIIHGDNGRFLLNES